MRPPLSDMKIKDIYSYSFTNIENLVKIVWYILRKFYWKGLLKEKKLEMHDKA